MTAPDPGLDGRVRVPQRPCPDATCRPRRPAPAGQPEFAPPPPSRTPQLLRRLQVVAALVLLVLGGVGALLITELRADLDCRPAARRPVRPARRGADPTARGSDPRHRGRAQGQRRHHRIRQQTPGPGGRGCRPAHRGGDRPTAGRRGPRRAEQRGHRLRRCPPGSRRTRHRDGPGPARQGRQAARHEILPDLAALQESLAAEASATSDGAGFVMPVLGIAAAAFLVWVSWVVAQRSRRVLNIGLVGAIVAVLVISWMTLEAQQATAVAAGQSRGTQFTASPASTRLPASSTPPDASRPRPCWPAAGRTRTRRPSPQPSTRPGRPRTPPSARAILGTYRTAEAALASADGEGRLAGRDKLALSTDKSGVAATSAASRRRSPTPVRGDHGCSRRSGRGAQQPAVAARSRDPCRPRRRRPRRRRPGPATGGVPMSTSAPAAPGQLGVAATPQQLMAYLGQLDAWLAERRARAGRPRRPDHRVRPAGGAHLRHGPRPGPVAGGEDPPEPAAVHLGLRPRRPAGTRTALRPDLGTARHGQRRSRPAAVDVGVAAGGRTALRRAGRPAAHPAEHRPQRRAAADPPARPAGPAGTHPRPGEARAARRSRPPRPRSSPPSLPAPKTSSTSGRGAATSAACSARWRSTPPGWSAT